eukprot:573184-Prorocentrum_lima.AAC.1
MTSSLVGSEMCIRDSLLSDPASGGGKNAEVNLRMVWLPDVRGNERVPVSYTHLTLPTICSV